MKKTYIFHYDKNHPVDDTRHAAFLAHDGMKCIADIETERVGECVDATFDDGISLYVFDYELDEAGDPKKNVYLMKIEGFFSGWKQFRIEAENKTDAVVRAKEYCKRHPEYGHGGNYKLDSIQCVKKLKG